MLHLVHHHPALWAANFVRNAVAELQTAVERYTTRGHQLCTSAIEGLVMLHQNYNLDIVSTQVGGYMKPISNSYSTTYAAAEDAA